MELELIQVDWSICCGDPADCMCDYEPLPTRTIDKLDVVVGDGEAPLEADILPDV